jgi:hypothetical protein
MPSEHYPVGILLATAFLGLSILFFIGLLVHWVRRKAPQVNDYDEFPEPEPMVQDPYDHILMRIDDMVSKKFAHQADIILELESRLTSMLVSQDNREILMAEALRQLMKDSAVIEQALQDVMRIISVSIAESKALSQKFQKHFDDPSRPLPQRLNPIR